MDNPIRERLEHERNVAKADVEFACDDDARFWAEERLAKFAELLEQCDELLAYVGEIEFQFGIRAIRKSNLPRTDREMGILEARPKWLND